MSNLLEKPLGEGFNSIEDNNTSEAIKKAPNLVEMVKDLYQEKEETKKEYEGEVSLETSDSSSLASYIKTEMQGEREFKAKEGEER